jgi:hypothetical protein
MDLKLADNILNCLKDKLFDKEVVLDSVEQKHNVLI